MEQQILGMIVDLDKMSKDSLLELRHTCERRISDTIRDANHINSALNSRLGSVALPEFGKPFTVHDELSSEQLSFEHDSFIDGLPPESVA